MFQDIRKLGCHWYILCLSKKFCRTQRLCCGLHHWRIW